MKFVIDHSAKILIAFIIVFLIFLSYLPNFSLDASSDSLVLENDVDLLFYNELRKKYPANDNLIISYKAQEPITTKTTLNNIKIFIKDLQQLKEVNEITSILNVPLFLSPKLSLFELATKQISIDDDNADLELAQQEFQQSPIYSDNLVSLDGKTTAILLNIKKNTEKAVADIRKVIAKHNDKAIIFLGGLPMITNDIISYIANDLVVFSVAIIATMALVLLIIFNNIRFMLIPIVISLISTIFTSSVISFLNLKITIISANFFSLLLVLTLAIVIHLIVRYRELSLTITNNDELILTTLQHMFKPCVYTTLTTVIAFVSLLISDIRPVIDFGFIMSLGVTLALIISFILFAVTMKLLPKTVPKQHKTQTVITQKIAFFTQKFRILIIILTVLFGIFSVFGITKITVENKFIDYFKQDTEISQGLSLIDDELGGTIDLEIIFKGLGVDYFNNEFIREDIAKVHNYLNTKKEIGKVLSIETAIQILTNANNGRRLSGFFINIAKNNIPQDAKKYILDPFINEKNDELRIVARVKEKTPNLNRNNLIKTIKTDLIAMGFAADSFRINGLMVLYNNMLQSLFDSQIKTIGLVLVMIWLMFLILFKSIKIATIAVITNLLPPLGVIGVMGVLAIPLDLMTITIVSIALGIGIDGAIHYITRFKIEFNKTNDYELSMFNTHKTIGLAIFYTAITVVIGFLTLVFSNFIPSIYFGIFTSIAMLLAIVLNLMLLPNLLILIKPKLN